MKNGIYQIESKTLKIKISEIGAELKSIYHKKLKKEYLWQADPKFWARTAPVLFPIVGKLKNDSYKINYKIFSMSQHGFARDRAFKLVQHEKDFISFELCHDEDSFRNYPYEFRLKISYQVDENELKSTCEIFNSENQVLIFSLGLHPAFQVSVDENGQYNELVLSFDKSIPRERHLLNEGLFNGEKESLKKLDKGLNLEIKADDFQKDAIVLQDIKASQVSMYEAGEKVLEMDFEGFPHFGIWSKPRAAFVCLEPWCGLADFENHKQQILQKKGIQRLSVGQKFEREVKMRFY